LKVGNPLAIYKPLTKRYNCGTIIEKNKVVFL
jgi:hypothetical protein